VLGKALFWDEQLSSDNSVACGTCHIPAAGGSDPRLDLANRHPGLDGVYGNEDDRFASAGVVRAGADGALKEDALFGFERQVTGRHSPSMIGASLFDELFWDGRASGTFVDPESGATSIPTGGALESQSLGPILSFVEMADEGRTWDDVKTKLARVQPLALASDITPDLAAALSADPTYPDLFDNAFGDPTITAERIAYALATYQRTLHPDQTPWDLFQQGVPGAMTGAQIQGFNTFMNPGLQCRTCHPPPAFTDGSFRNLGLRDIAEDNGRQAVTGLFSDRGKFKVPSLRNVGLRSRFFHNGDPTWQSLFLAIFIYNQGVGFFPENNDPALSGIFMAPATASTILNFLSTALDDPRVANELPPFDRPTLASERGTAATLVGAARAGSGGFEPRIVAVSPAYVGAGEFRVAMHSGLGGADAVLVATTANGPGLGSIAGGATLARPASRILARASLAGVGAGAGTATWRGQLPADPAFSGTTLDLRWLVRDPGAASSVAATETARMIVW
ncbi:MAG: cytochrome c peroxidase, partial [Planctomycetota bacterium]